VTDWGTFVQYMFILLITFTIGLRINMLVRHLHRVDAKISYLAFIETMRVQGVPYAEIVARLDAMGESARQEMEFAKLAEQAKPGPLKRWRMKRMKPKEQQ